MPQRIPMRRERRILANMVINILRQYYLAYRTHTHESFEVDLGNFLVGGAVLLGYLEGRPLNAHKIALILNTPRTTVLRKLAWLMKHDLVIKSGGSYIVNADVIARHTSHIPEITREVRKAVDALSKLNDTAEMQQADRTIGEPRLGRASL
jgi:hypothetical protein